MGKLSLAFVAVGSFLAMLRMGDCGDLTYINPEYVAYVTLVHQYSLDGVYILGACVVENCDDTQTGSELLKMEPSDWEPVDLTDSTVRDDVNKDINSLTSPAECFGNCEENEDLYWDAQKGKVVAKA